MSYKSVLVPMIVTETSRFVAEAALMIAGSSGGHVVGYHIHQTYYYYPMSVGGDGLAYSSEVYASLEKASATISKTQRDVFWEACDTAGAHRVSLETASEKAGLTASWQDSEGIVPTDVSRAARIADLSVVALPGKNGNGLEFDLIERLLMASGKPVLLIPRSGLPALPQRVLVGWDGSRAAARAVDAALPLLQAAKEVRLVTIEHTNHDTPNADEAANYLRLHGIDAMANILDKSKGGVAAQILTEASSSKSDLLVLGGYTHSRFEEALLGGVTRYMLDHAECSILMAH